MPPPHNDIPQPAMKAARRIAQLYSEIQSNGMIKLTIIKIDGVVWLSVDGEARMERLGK